MCKICFLPSFFRSILQTNVYPFNSGFDWLWNIRLYKLLSNKQINMCFACLRQPEQWCLDFHQSFLSLLKLIWVSYWSAEPQGLQFAKCFPTFDECRKPKIKGNIPTNVKWRLPQTRQFYNPLNLLHRIRNPGQNISRSTIPGSNP